MRLVYLTTLSYPSRFANRLQVMKMSEAFSRITDFTLFVSCVEENKEDVFVNYHVTHPIHIEQIGPTKRWPQSFWMARKLAKKIKSEPADTVFYVRELPLAFWLTLLSKKFRKAFFFEAQSLEKFHILFYNRVFPRARGIITSSRKKADLLQNMYGIPARNTPIVMYAGSLQSDYGIHTMIAAAGILANEATFILIGRCDFDITLPNIVRIEQVPRHEIPRYLMDADILIAPYSDKNYFIKQYSVPIKISEYMAAGKPFIISDMPSIREVLKGF